MPKKSGELKVGVKSILVNAGNEKWSAAMDVKTNEPSLFDATLDSTMPYLYLPRTICDQFAKKLGLQFDEDTKLYTLNDTQRDQNLQSISSIQITVTDMEDHSKTTTISFSYAAFDVQASWPIYENSTSVFPIRRANGTYILGRTFFQEAYIIADFERRNFTLAKAVFPQPSVPPHFVGIYNLSAGALPNNTTSSSKNYHNQATLIGVATVVGLGALGLLVLGIFVYRRRVLSKRAEALAAQEDERRRKILSELPPEMDSVSSVARPRAIRGLSELSSDVEIDQRRILNWNPPVSEMEDMSDSTRRVLNTRDGYRDSAHSHELE
jgi:hypothetical protein